MRAIILAAGLGSRLGALTAGQPKCLLELHGRSLLEHQLALLAACDIDEIAIVTGYAADQVRAAAGDRAQFAHYPDFASTNNLLTLHHCRQLLAGELLILFADVLVSAAALRRCARDPREFALLVDASQCLAGTMRVRLAGENVVDLGSHITPSDGHGNFVGIAKCSALGARLLTAELAELAATGEHKDAYYTAALARLAARGTPLAAVQADAAGWLEIDTPEDYVAAQSSTFYLPGAAAAAAP